MTNKQAKAIIADNIGNTAYKGFTSLLSDEIKYISFNEMYDFFRQKGMGKAETLTIIASMKLAGCEFVGELTADD